MLNLDGIGGMNGWQWMFIIEAVPALLMTFVVLSYLTDRPSMRIGSRRRTQLAAVRLDASAPTASRIQDMSWTQSMLDPRVIALGFVYMGCNIPQYGLSFFLPQIVKAFGGRT